jgi:hypothetical protein
VVLCVTAAYHKLLPYIILTSKTKAKNEMSPEGVILCAQNNGLMTTHVME